MGDRVVPGLAGVAETLLLPLYARAVESRRTDGVLRDRRAEALVARLDYDFGRFALHGFHQPARVMATREIDRITREFLARHPDGVVVHIGCGLDTRFERVDNGSVNWFDLDLPDVVGLRRELGLASGPGLAAARYHLIAGSAFDVAWMADVAAVGDRAVLLVAEGVLTFFPAELVKELLVAVAGRFPGAELVFDVFQPWALRVGNAQLAVMKLKAPMRWGLKRPEDVLAWGEGFRLLEAWYYFDRPEPRLRRVAWMRHIPAMRHVAGIFHYRLEVQGAPLPGAAAPGIAAG
jgi:O-methyltransferase involved in polyketide biosynthesis